MRLIVLVFFTLAWQVNNANAESLRQVLSRHMQARGGSETLENAKSIYLRVDVFLPSGKLEIVSWGTRDGRARINVTKSGTFNLTSIVVNRDVAYEIVTNQLRPNDKPTKKRKLTPEYAYKYWTDSIWPLIGANEFKSLWGYELFLLGKRKIKDHFYWVIRTKATQKTPKGYVPRSELFIDTETYLLSHVKFKSDDGRQTEVHYSDFQFLGPIVIPLKSEWIDSTTQITRSAMEIRHAKLNPELDAGRFDPNVLR